jgi:hypothetical protein
LPNCRTHKGWKFALPYAGARVKCCIHRQLNSDIFIWVVWDRSDHTNDPEVTLQENRYPCIKTL